MAKKFYRCTVCGDLHYGEEYPETCPTCLSEDAYEEISDVEAEEELDF